MSELTNDEQRYLSFLKKLGGKADKTTMYRTLYRPIGGSLEQTLVRKSLLEKGLITVETEVSSDEGRDPTYVSLT